MRRTLGFAVAAIVAVGCTSRAGKGDLVKLEDSQPKTQAAGQIQTAPPAPTIIGTQAAPEEKPEPHKAPVVSLHPAIKFVKGDTGVYKLTNDITIFTAGDKADTLNKQKSYLNAMQAVSVEDVKGKKGTITVKTTDVSAGVTGTSVAEVSADAYMKETARSIEGSTLQGNYDSTGKGTDLILLGKGIGLNPMGPQIGSQDVSVGFMGVLLPSKSVKVGDKWSGAYDISQSVQDLFQSSGGVAQNGETTIWYTLLDFDEEKNYVKLGISGHGRPLVKIPAGGGTLTIQMDVKIDGQAVVRMDSGWLQQMKVESTIVTEGLAASKEVVNSVTQRVG
ncbi:MAG TPA: hypothetical protein VNI20_07655 [Fimbriimonadaceae bacterium]|nr:hypothetical protein [Fimbriimonadaceae bacterium]